MFSNDYGVRKLNSNRKAGILLHITSLPSKYGVGTLGKSAYEFVDWLKKSKITIWQVLPLVPTNYGDSPYQSVSTTALNYYLIDLDILNEKGLLEKKEYKNEKFAYSNKQVDYEILFDKKISILRKAFNRFDINDKAFKKFVSDKHYNDFAVFMTLKSMHGYKPWNEWNLIYKTYSKQLEESIIKNYNEDYLFWVWTQFEFLNEWNDLKKYANKAKVEIMGDMPLYVAYDSVEVWKNHEYFMLNDDLTPKLVAGCPPDGFTEDGQLWGNPVYDWKYLKEHDYEFWKKRLSDGFKLFDIIRLDHFRGFDRFYAIPYGSVNARVGKWLDGPKFDLFKDMLDSKIVAEDLGFIDEGVIQLMKQTGFAGMKILEFAFDGRKENEHKPSNYTENCAVYTGTHDNMPLYQHISDMDESTLKTLKKDLKKECKLLNVKPNTRSAKKITETIIELAFASIAKYCIIPMQDLLCQDKSARMNLPSTVSKDNWSYRVSKKDISDKLAERLNTYVTKYRR